MKSPSRLLIIALAAALMTFVCSFALATMEVVQDLYSDAPANPTQDNVIELSAVQPVPGEEPMPYTALTMEPSSLTINVLGEIFDFVEVIKRPPARYFPEETQQEIVRILDGGDPDILYMPEFFSMFLAADPLPEKAVMDMLMDIQYDPGRLVVVVLGRETADGIVWKALDADILVQDVIHYEIPQDVLADFAGHETLCAVLSVKPGSGWSESEPVFNETETNIPSKSGSDITHIEDNVTISGEGEALDCRIIVVPETDMIRAEMVKLNDWFCDLSKVPLDYFDPTVRSEVEKLLPEVNAEELLPFEVVNVMVENYQEPYGDVMARVIFVTPFENGQPLVSVIGMPDQEGVFDWTPLHTEVKLPYVEITFSSTVLPAMMKDAGILLVFSIPNANQ